MIMMPMLDVPLICINKAAIEFHVPAKLILSVLLTERGKLGQTSKNLNGTYDIGPMQVNSSWLTELKRYGVTQKTLQYDACENVRVGAWILSQKIARRNDLLVGVGDYNSHTFKLNQNYYTKVRINFTKINRLLTSVPCDSNYS